jgi:hypothetical protein
VLSGGGAARDDTDAACENVAAQPVLVGRSYVYKYTLSDGSCQELELCHRDFSFGLAPQRKKCGGNVSSRGESVSFCGADIPVCHVRQARMSAPRTSRGFDELSRAERDDYTGRKQRNNDQKRSAN